MAITRRFAIPLLLAVAPLSCAGAAAPQPAQQDAAMAAILARPATVDPFAYAGLVEWLWRHGRRQQATFWFYVFQERTRPWADADNRGDGAAALRASLNEELGTVINRWVAGDVVAWRAIVARALSFEAHLPLADARPDGLSREVWLARVARSRADYTAAARAAFARMQPADVARSRHAAGLPVGSLQDAGPPLPAAWH